MEIKILQPVFVLVFLTLVIWIRMFYVRFSEMTKAGLKPADLRPDNVRNLPPKIIFSGDNFRNLCELPILFYTLIILLILFEQVDSEFVSLAWVFVLLRAVHSFIHTTYNHTVHRFIVYMIGACILWLMWIRFAFMTL